MWKVYGIMFIVVVVISLLWVRGITDMHEKHPDYKGDDEGFDDEKEDEEI
jgi:hypothetical protein